MTISGCLVNKNVDYSVINETTDDTIKVDSYTNYFLITNSKKGDFIKIEPDSFSYYLPFWFKVDSSCCSMKIKLRKQFPYYVFDGGYFPRSMVIIRNYNLDSLFKSIKLDSLNFYRDECYSFLKEKYINFCFFHFSNLKAK